MRKITLMFASLLLTFNAVAQEMPRLTAEQLNVVTKKLPIAIRCTQNDSYNDYYDGSGKSSGFTLDKVFYWTPVVDGTSGTYYIINNKEEYLQKPTGVNATDFYTFGTIEGAAELHAIHPTTGGASNPYIFSEHDLVYDNGTDPASSDYLVRIALSDDTRWLNISKLSTTGTGIWTVQNVYDATDAEEILNNAQINAWKTASISTLGYVGGYTESEKAAIEAITTIAGITEFEAANHEVVELNTSAYYRLVCVSPKTGNSGDTSYNTLTFDGTTNLVTAPTGNANFNQIFKFEDAGDGKFYLKNLNANGYLNKISASSYRSAIVAGTNDACKVELKAYGKAQWEVHNSESTNDKHSLFAENHPTEAVPYACAGWESGSNSASAWYIVPVAEMEITINEFASICLPFPVKVEGATAYAIESTNETHAILAEKTDIPAGEGAILEGNGTAKLSLVSEASSDWTGNMLIGTTVDTYVEGAAYVLSKGSNGNIGLYRTTLNKNSEGTEGTTHFKNNANKAYLVVEGTEAPMFSFGRGEGTTAIDNVELTNANVVIYDLAGRRVEKMEKGIYIVNGKKVIK